MDSRTETSAVAWYRHRWPWILIAGPALVVVASLITLWLAIASSDGLVTEDYYRKGLAINQTLARSDRARSLALAVGVRLMSDGISVRVHSKAPAFAPPPQILVTISHPTRAGLDQSQILSYRDGRYSGKFRLPAAGHWVIRVEDDAKTWRVMGNLILPASGETVLGERTSEDKPE